MMRRICGLSTTRKARLFATTSWASASSHSLCKAIGDDDEDDDDDDEDDEDGASEEDEEDDDDDD